MARVLVAGCVLAVLLGGAARTSSAATTSCTYAPQLNQATIGQGLPYVRLVRGKESLVRLFFSLPASVPRCAGSTPAIRVNSATLTVRNKSDNNNLLRSAVPAEREAIGALITAPAPTKTRPAIAADAPADPKFAVGGLAPSSPAAFTASFAGTIKYQSRASDGSYAPEVTQTFTSFTPPGGTSTLIEKLVEKQTRNLRLLTIPMKVTPTATTASALATGMDNFSRIWPVQDGTAVPDGTPVGPRTGTLLGSTGGLRFSINPGVVNVSGQLDSDGRWCGSGPNFTTTATGMPSSPQSQLLGFKNAWNGVVNGVDTPAEQDADRVLGFIGAQDSVPSTENRLPQCLEGYAIVNTDAAFGRVTEGPSAMTGPVLVQEAAHLFGAAAGTGTYHSLYTESDTQDPNLAYNVMTRSQLPSDRTAMKLVLPWDNGNTGLEKDHFAYLLCGQGGDNTGAGCPSAPATGTFTGVGAGVGGAADVIYGVTNGTPEYTEANTNSLQSSDACCTTPDPDSPYRFVQLDAGGGVLEDEGVPVRSTLSEHGQQAETLEGSIGSFNFATVPVTGATKFQLKLRNTVLYERGVSAPPVLNEPTVAPPSGSPVQYTTGSGDELEPAVSQDGEWLAWMEQDVVICSGGDCGPEQDMVSVAPSADEETYVRLGVASQEPAWRPDGKALAYVADGDIYTIPVMTSGDTATFGTPTKIYDGDLIEGLGGSHPTWSPDGAFVAFAADGNIWKVPAAGGTAVQLTTTNDASAPSWSHTAADNRLAFVREVTGGGSPSWQTFFADEFNGASIDSDDWNTSIATSGVRFCQATGTWANCASSYGSLTSTGAVARFTGNGTTAFPYIWKGAPTRSSAFPISGDFAFELRVDYNALAFFGDGLQVKQWNDTTPTGSNSPFGPGGVMTLHGDSNGLRAGFVGTVGPIPIANGLAAHTYRVEYVEGAYSLYVDGVRRAGPTVSSRRPNAIWVGYPLKPSAGAAQWSNFDLDYFRVFEPGAPAAATPAIYTLNPSEASPTPVQLVANATEPSWGSSGLIGFVRDGDVWTVASDGSNPSLLAADGRRPSLDTNVIAFDRFIPATIEGGQFDIFLIRSTGEQQVTVTGSDNSPAQTRTTFFFDCGGRKYPIAVDLRPSSISGSNFEVDFPFDSSATCGDSDGEGTLTAVTHDGYSTSAPGATTVASEPKRPVPAITGLSAEYRQWEGIVATGTAVDQDGGNVPGERLRWAAPDGLFAGFRYGNVIEVTPPPTTGWDTGATNAGRQYTLELAVVDGSGDVISDVVTTTATVLPDKDHDGMTAGKESQSCFTTGDLDPFNAFRDYDGDGDWNVSDPHACTADAPSSTAEFDPDPLVLPSSGTTVSMKIRVLYRNIAQVLSSSVRLKTIDGVDVSTDDRFRNVRWTVNADGSATALFDKQKLIQWLIDHNVKNRRFKIEVTGRSAAPVWDFTAADDVYAQWSG